MKGLPMTFHFVQRKTEMMQLETFFQSKSDKIQRKVFVVRGLGGMGKTQLCVEYVRSHKNDFTAIFWLDGSSKDALRQSLANASARLPSALTSPADQSIQGGHAVDRLV